MRKINVAGESRAACPQKRWRTQVSTENKPVGLWSRTEIQLKQKFFSQKQQSIQSRIRLSNLQKVSGKTSKPGCRLKGIGIQKATPWTLESGGLIYFIHSERDCNHSCNGAVDLDRVIRLKGVVRVLR